MIRILVREAFARSGANASLDDIARLDPECIATSLRPMHSFLRRFTGQRKHLSLSLGFLASRAREADFRFAAPVDWRKYCAGACSRNRSAWAACTGVS